MPKPAKPQPQRLRDFQPDPQNANQGTPRGAQMVEDSLRAYGAGRSILVDRHGVVIAGNKTLEAAASLGFDDVVVVPSDGKRLIVVQRTDLDLATDAAARELGIVDNRAAEVGLSWDAGVLQSLAESGADLSRFFTSDELAVLVAQQLEPQEGLTDPDAVPEARATDIQPGDLFELAAHRLLCGDSTKAEDMSRVLSSVVPRLMVTDPPYGVEYDPEWRSTTANQQGTLAGTKGKAVGKVANDDRVDWTPVWELFPGDVAYVWHAGNCSAEMAVSLLAARFDVRAQLIWRKPQFVISRGHYHPQHEPCWYAVRKGKTSQWCGDRKQSTIWDIAGMAPFGRSRDAADDAVGHSTQKPVECMQRPMRNHEAPEVYDPFCGSGTSIIAAEQIQRRCYAIELEPTYVQMTIDRWEQFTGKRAVKVGEAVRGGG